MVLYISLRESDTRTDTSDPFREIDDKKTTKTYTNSSTPEAKCVISIDSCIIVVSTNFPNNIVAIGTM